MQKGLATVAQLGDYDDIIDARTPAEYAQDHIPGARNLPALGDEERVRVGTLYKQVSPFEARKLGAVLVARNVAAHVEAHCLDKPRSWRPLVYCWRGGKRSGAFTHVLREIGWDAARLDGGYKRWRAHVIERLAALPGRMRFRVVSGATGSGKSRLLEALGRKGVPILHLEDLAAHKGSVLGSLPDRPQPSQKMFETRLCAALEALARHPGREVYVEAESRRIGTLNLPDSLIAAIRAAPCLRVEATPAARVAFLLGDYDYFLADPRWLIERLAHLRGLQSNETVDRWRGMVESGDFPALVAELLEKHYDPLYERSQNRNYQDFAEGDRFATDDLAPESIAALADRVLAGRE